MLLVMAFFTYRHQVMLRVLVKRILMERIIYEPILVRGLLIDDVMRLFRLVLITDITDVDYYLRVISRVFLIDYRAVHTLHLLSIQLRIFHKIDWHIQCPTYIDAIIGATLPLLNHTVIDNRVLFVKGDSNMLHE